jgi:hypothetical protein
MVVNNFYVSGFIFDPFEADSPLVVDANAVLTRTGSLEFFKPVSWWSL